MLLRHDPMQIFHTSKTPVSLYARHKWLGEGLTLTWKKDFDETVSSLLAGQSSLGCWGCSYIDTIQRLFQLHLTIRKPSENVRSALMWLIDSLLTDPIKRKRHMGERIAIQDLYRLPFTLGSVNILLVASTLFLASVFENESDDRVLFTYDWFSKELLRGSGRFHGWANTSNILRALVVHSKYSISECTSIVVSALEASQTVNGNWPDGVPFYKTFNALAHVNTSEANRQFERTLERVYKLQSPDGTWGKVEPEFTTFLVVHALKRKSLL